MISRTAHPRTIIASAMSVRWQRRGCEMKLATYQIGSDNSDERGFRHRLKRSLAKVQAANAAKPAATAPGQAATETSQ